MNRSLDFMIIGAQKSGTTALASFLAQQPGICMASNKEVHLFDGEDFDPQWSAQTINERYEPWFAGCHPTDLLGEATPIYLYWPEIAPALARYNPALKLIVVLRDPVERAISHYMMERSRGNEQLPMALAFLLEPWRRARRNKRGVRCAGSGSRLHSYLDRGHYARQLTNLRCHFADQQILVLDNETLLCEHYATLTRVLDFLGLRQPPAAEPVRVFSGNYRIPSAYLYQLWLGLYFGPGKRRLRHLLRQMGQPLPSWL